MFFTSQIDTKDPILNAFGDGTTIDKDYGEEKGFRVYFQNVNGMKVVAGNGFVMSVMFVCQILRHLYHASRRHIKIRNTLTLSAACSVNTHSDSSTHVSLLVQLVFHTHMVTNP